MADEDRDQTGPSLELPSFGFGRKRRKRDVEPPVAAAAPTEEAPPVAAAAPTEEAPPVEDASAPEAERAAPPAAAPAPTAAFQVEPEPALGPDAPAAPPASVDEGRHKTQRHPAVVPAPTPAEDSRPSRRRPRLPALGGRAAAVVTGLVVGALGVGLTWASLGVCDAVKGTSSCGNSGYLLLVAILVAMVLIGSALLRAWDVADATSISFLAVGLLAVFVLVFLVDALESWTMILVIPLATAATYVLSHWVTSSITEDGAA